ncbi:MAG: NAD-dependent epimerase/dehydratase family protein [Bacteriovoracaceae bacterium]|nr:NAD-dependent epimerase/dehydratase family protein [Bacteriovoracaceae bacterium]
MSIKNILIIGIQGALAKITAELLIKTHPNIHILGVDSRGIENFSNHPQITFQQMKYNRTNFEKLFREHHFDSVLHLGRLGHSPAMGNIHKRIDINLVGTNTILELAQKFSTKKVVILSTHHVYGALADNPMFLKEDAPLRASFKHAELRDVVEMDQMCTNWMWKNQNQIETVVLRPANIIGPQIKNAITQYLKTPYAPIPIDYNPMFQFIHEFDMATIIVKAFDSLKTGIYNVCSDDIVSLHEAAEIIDVKKIKVPIIAVEQLARFLTPVWKFPLYLIDYIKYPSTLDNSELKKNIGPDVFRFTAKEALELLKLN